MMQRGLRVRIRPTARLLLVDPDDRVLLLKIEDPAVADPDDPREKLRRGEFWCSPGGGVEEGETFEEAAKREAWEEVGLAEVELGACVFEREKTLAFADETLHFHERYYFVRVPTNVVSYAGHTELEQRVVRGHHWWSLAELEATDEVIFPEGLVDLMRPLLS